MKNAIILAAGMGSRLVELTNLKPKPLTSLYGQTIIESQIALLQANGIKDITVVTGYLHEQFMYLKEKYNISILVNHDYERKNNIYSLYIARHKLSDTLIIEGDIAVFNNFLAKHYKPGYFVRQTKEAMKEWQIEYDENLKVTAVTIDGYGRNSFIGFTYLDQKNSSVLKKRLEEEIQKGDYQQMFWDEVIIKNFKEFTLYVNLLEEDDCYEIDTLTDYHLAIKVGELLEF